MLVAIILLVLLVALLLSVPAVQTRLAHELTDYLNTELGTEIEIDKLSITYDFQVEIKDVYIGDHHNDTLITAESLKTSLINIPGLFSGDNIDFGDVTAEHLVFRLRRYKGDPKDTFGMFLDRLSQRQKNKNKKGARVLLTHLHIFDSKFSFVDEQARYPNIVNLTDLNIDASNFVIEGSNISIDINKLKAQESRGLQIDNLSTQFRLLDNAMNFDNFSLKTPQSSLAMDVHFSFDYTMADFENKVHMDADVKQASLAIADLHKFYSPFGQRGRLSFGGEMSGTLNDLTLKDFIVYGMRHTTLNGQMHFDNIFGEKRFKYDANLSLLETDYKDLINLLPGILRGKLPEYLKRLGHTQLQGRVSVTKNMVSTNALIKSKLGLARADAILSDLQNTGHEQYRGKLKFINFDLGQLLNNPNVGEASFTFNMTGSGFNTQSLNSNLDGVFSSLRFYGYTYHDIRVKGVLRTPVFTGQLISNDPNLQMHFDGTADVSGQKNNYDFTAVVEHADLYSLNFIKKDTAAAFKGKVVINMHGHNVDDVVGSIDLENAAYTNKKGTYKFKTLNITSSFAGKVRKITINSPDIINGQLEGYFVLSQLPALFKNAVGNLYSNYKPIPIAKNQYLYFDVAVYNKVVQALFPSITLSPNTFIRGKVRSSNSDLQLVFKSPQISVGNNKLHDVDLQLDNTNPLFTTYFDVGNVELGAYNLSRVHLISKRVNDTLFVQTEFKGGQDDKDEFNLNFYHTINEANKSVVGIRKSNLRFKNNTWTLNKDKEDQSLVFDNDFKSVKLDTLVMSYQDQKIAISGYKHGKWNKKIDIDFDNVDLQKVTPSIENLNLAGILNGELKVEQRQGIYYPLSNLQIHNFAINAIDYGELNLNILGNRSLTSYTVNANIVGANSDYFLVYGDITLGGNDPKIDAYAVLGDFNIGLLNAFGKNVISDVRGSATGYAHIGGSYRLPSIDGELLLNEAGLKIPYLNVDMAFEKNAVVKLSQQEFYFDHVNFEDTKYHTKGVIDGTIAHHNFKNWRMNLDLQAPDRLLVLDTDYTDESLYYGTAFISGDAHIAGPFNELVIDVTATSEKGTVFKIPLSDAETIGNNSYIYFLSPEDKEARKEGKDIVFKQLKGLEMNFDLDVTDDADIEIVVDEESGSTLRGRGAGTLLMEINTNGKFNMWGDFVVYHGTYDFKYAGLIEKQFEVVPGGNITWDGSPIRANLNIRALYQTQANPASLLENPTINRSIPVNVYIDLSGLLTNVDITFELEYPNLSSMVKSELEYRISDRKNTEIQALSLITQGSFYSTITPGRTAHPENLLYERAAGLFNDIFSGADDKFKVGVNYTKGNRAPDQEISDRVGVTLSTNVSDRILINGRVGVPIGGLTRSVVVGNVEIEFLLNEEGSLRAKVFNRESDIQYIGEELGYTQGVGISYSVDFDTFKELIQKILNKDLKPSQVAQELKTEEETSLVPDYIKFPGE